MDANAHVNSRDADAGEPPKRIPRPPNAFILFRSDLLKKDVVKKNCPPHQQILSRLAGDMWNMLPDAERQAWKDKAKEYHEHHRHQYPDYIFKPARRSKKAKSRTPVDNTTDFIRSLRETHFGEQFKGPSARPSRKAKEAADKAIAQQQQQQPDPPILAPSPLPLPPTDMQTFDWATASGASPSYAPAISPLDRACYSTMALPTFGAAPPLSLYDGDSSVPACFPQRTFPHFEPPRFGTPRFDTPRSEVPRFEAPRRPSTSLGFIRRLDEGPSLDNTAGLERPASAAGFVRDLPFMPGPPFDANFAAQFFDSTMMNMASEAPQLEYGIIFNNHNAWAQ
ncbi:hypothetical protein C8F01DRAFT_598148 [Mycena amicta]|nr:hypothetical protein C8F01DRAFT_598148 [Mycena amicta]